MKISGLKLLSGLKEASGLFFSPAQPLQSAGLKKTSLKTEGSKRLSVRYLPEGGAIKIHPLLKILTLISFMIAAGCTEAGLRLLGQLEATALKQAVINDREFCKLHIGAGHKRKQDLCNDFFASLRITSHCVTMRKTELVEQEYCERFLYRMLIRPSRIFGQDDETASDLMGTDGVDWFDDDILDIFLVAEPGTNSDQPATPEERKSILKRIAESSDLPNLAQGVREQDRQLLENDIKRGNDLAGDWRGRTAANRMLRLERLFQVADDQASIATFNDTAHKARTDKLEADIVPDVTGEANTQGVQSFLSIALQDPVNIRAVQWIDDYLYGMAYKNRGAAGTETEKAKKQREIYLKSWCSLHWDDDDDQKMLTLHDTTLFPEAWHEDNKFFAILLAAVLQNNRPASPPASAAWWQVWTPAGDGTPAAAWVALAPNGDDTDRVEAVFRDVNNEWRDGTKNICATDLDFAPLQ